MGAAACLLLVPAESRAVEEHLLGFPDADAEAHRLRPVILAGLCFLPALAAIAYSLGNTFDRYLTRRFLGSFGICLSALFLIWFLIDLSDNVSEFRAADELGATMLTFYINRVPAVLMYMLPYGLLLALLYELGKLSNNREILAFIQSGRGIVRISVPLMVAGVFFTLFCLGINYQWAPTAEGGKDQILDRARGLQVTEATHVIYRNPNYERLWVIGAFPENYEMGEPLLDVEVTTTDERHRILSRLSAGEARWDRESRQWTFGDAMLATFEPGSPPVFEKSEGPLAIDNWPETPLQLIRPGLSPEYLGIPELNTWLNTFYHEPSGADPAPYLTQWHYRWALPFACVVIVLIATPLAIHFSRRGAGGGVFLAVVLAALMQLVSGMVLAIGEAGIIQPAAAAWLPNGLFALFAAYLFHRRLTGRPIYHTLRRILPGGED